MDLSDLTEVGSGNYTSQFVTQPYTLSRGGITELGTFGVGEFEKNTNVDEVLLDKSKTYKLFQNYPNPFGSFTQINVEIPENAHIKLKVYNVVGETIMIIDKEMPAGEHTFVLDGTGLPNGIYYYTLEANDFIQTKQMIVIK
ncbi:MAG: T9SS type A sorting domain-containing protein [Bacteroidales bacterium]|nr:T9SS type A sorting domain-containing protein [Bacteroidales bacterium]